MIGLKLSCSLIRPLSAAYRGWRIVVIGNCSSNMPCVSGSFYKLLFDSQFLLRCYEYNVFNKKLFNCMRKLDHKEVIKCRLQQSKSRLRLHSHLS